MDGDFFFLFVLGIKTPKRVELFFLLLEPLNFVFSIYGIKFLNFFYWNDKTFNMNYWRYQNNNFTSKTK